MSAVAVDVGAAHYYLSTGSKTCFYTLRVRGVERAVVGYRQFHNYDYHVKNLSIDKGKAMELGQAYANEHGGAFHGDPNFDLNEISREEALPPASFRFKFGKHNGEMVEDVVNSDPEYLLWVLDNFSEENERHGHIVKRIKGIIKAGHKVITPMYEEKIAEEARKELARLDRESKWRAEQEASRFVGNEKDKVELVVTVFATFFSDSQWGGYRTVVMRDENGNFIKAQGSSKNLYSMKRNGEYRICATVKKHDYYKLAQQTTVARVKVIETIKEGVTDE